MRAIATRTNIKQWSPATLSLTVWFVVAYSAVSWTFKTLEAQGPALSSEAPSTPNNNTNLLARSLGAQATPTEVPHAASRLKLLGVLADTNGMGGALIAIDNQAPKLYRIGATVVDGLTVQALKTRQVVIGNSADATTGITLELPKQP